MTNYFAVLKVALIECSVIVHVLFYGILLCNLAHFRSANRLLRYATICGAGLSGFCFELWLAGYVNAWTIPCYLFSTLVALIYVIYTLSPWQSRSTIQNNAKGFVKLIAKILPASAANCYLGLLSLIVVAISLVACFKPPINGDEVAYHWPAPLRWATMHHWAPSPFRFANGPTFIQLLFLPSAFFQDITAGHLTHFLTWVVLTISACGLGAVFAASVPAVVAAICACPVITTLAVQMQNDVGVTAFTLAAVASLVALREESDEHRIKKLLICSLIFCGALSSKLPFAAALMPMIAAFIWVELKQSTLKKQLLQQTAFFLPALATMLFWSLHTFHLTGGFFDVPVKAVWTNSTAPTDPVHPYSGVLGLAGPPSPQKFLVLCLAPFVTWLIGNQEPFGGRTGVLIPIFLALFLVFQRKFEDRQRRLALWLLAFSVYYYVGIGIFVIRVRYHLLVWTLWSLLCAITFSFLHRRWSGKKRTALAVLYSVLVTASCVDTVRTLLIWNSASPQLLPQVPWLLK